MFASEYTDANLTEYVRLYRKTMRTKFILLLLTFFANWMIWTTIQAGNQALPNVEASIKKDSEDFIKKWGIDDLNTDWQEGADPNDIFALMPKLDNPFWKDNKFEKYGNFMTERNSLADKFEREQTNAYKVPIHLPYLESSLGMNFLLLAEYWPFVLISLVSVIIVFAMRERAYALMLSSCLSANPNTSESSALLAMSDFRIGRLVEAKEGNETIYVYTRPFIIHPELILWLVLLIGIAYSSIDILTAYDPTFAHPVNDILFDYFAAVWFFACAALYLLWRTRDYYAEWVRRVVGEKWRGRYVHLVHVAAKRFLTWTAKRKWRSIALRAVDGLIGLLALGSLFTPWLQEGEVSGYYFLLKQSSMPNPFSWDPPGKNPHPIDPSVFNELRIQLWIAIIFVAVCIVGTCLWPRIEKRLGNGFARFRFYFGLLVLLLSGNLLFHIWKLEIQSEQLLFTGLLTNGTRIGGRPSFSSLMSYDPDAGLIIFIFLCVLLTIVSLLLTGSQRTRHHSPPTHPPEPEQ